MTIIAQEGLNVFWDMFTSISLFGVDWLMSIILVFFCLLLITRNVHDWKILALPLFTIWHALGVQTSFAVLVLAGIAFVLEMLSFQMIGNLVGGTIENVTKITGLDKSGKVKDSVDNFIEKQQDKRQSRENDAKIMAAGKKVPKSVWKSMQDKLVK